MAFGCLFLCSASKTSSLWLNGGFAFQRVAFGSQLGKPDSSGSRELDIAIGALLMPTTLPSARSAA
jgi:hypothetical protein